MEKKNFFVAPYVNLSLGSNSAYSALQSISVNLRRGMLDKSRKDIFTKITNFIKNSM